MKKKIISSLLAMLMVTGAAAIPAAAAETEAEAVAAAVDTEAVSAVTPGKVTLNGAESFNFSAQNYSRWSQTVKSYLMQKSDGTLERVEYDTNAGKLLYEVYSADGKTKKSSGYIANELDLFGGVFSGSDYNYVVYGKRNSAHSDSAEVLRIVKYSKDWKKQSYAMVRGANTAVPFDAGSLRMTESNGKLYIHTCHGMYGGHQANMSYVITESNMSVAEANYDVSYFGTGYVSHSFNQFVKEDGTSLYRVDHGDAYPRAITLTKAGLSGNLKSVTTAQPVDLSNTGSTGSNDTGASVGGFELSSDKCIIAFNAVDFTKANADPYGKRNIYLSFTGKDLSSTKNIKITNYSSTSNINVSTPQLVKLSNTRFLLLWEEINTDQNTVVTKLCTVNGSGQIESQGIVTTNYLLSDCQPILCKDGGVRWYAGMAEQPVLYTVNPSALSQSAGGAAQPMNKEIPVTLEVGESYTVPAAIVSGSGGKGWGGYYEFMNSIDTSTYTVTAKEPTSGYINFSMNYGGTVTYNFTIIAAVPRPGAPTLTLTNTAAGLKASWNSVDLAKSYDVFYRLTMGSTLSKLSTTATSVIIPNTQPGMPYYVQVQSIGENGVKGAVSTSKSLTYIPQVKPLVTLVNQSNGLLVSWNAIDRAEKYMVAYKETSGSTWTTVKTANLNYTLTNLTPGTKYSAYVKPIYNGTKGVASTTNTKIYVPQVKTTVKLSNKTNGIRASWTAIAGATKYNVYYKQAGDSAWTTKETTSLNYTLTGIEPGMQYFVRVKPLFNTVYGMYSDTVSLAYVPQLQTTVSLANQANGIRANWTAVSGATSYIVYYKAATASNWSSKCTTALTYTVTGLAAGTEYSIRVKPVFAGTPGLYSAISKLTYVPQVKPVVTLSNKSNGIRAEWAAVTGATKYLVLYRQTGASTWTSVETANPYYAITGITPTVEYQVKVRAIFVSSYGLYSSTVKLTYVPQAKPKLTLANQTNAIRAEWKAINGATKYIVYYKQSDASSWSSTETTNLYYLYQGTKPGISYSIQVKPVFNTLNGVYSSVYKLTYVPQVRPVVTLTNKTNGVRASWSAISGATKYTVYYKKTDDATWSSVQTTNCYYTYTAAAKGTGYSFQVQPVFGNANGLYSTVKSITFN